MKLLIRFLAAVCGLFLVSCIDGREEFWLNADGSGSAEITYTIPEVSAKLQGGAQGVTDLLEKFLKGTPAIRSSSHEVTTKDGRMTIHVRASFASATELGEIEKGGATTDLPSSATGLTGDISVAMSGRTLSFSRVIHAGRALPGSLFMPSSEFKDHKLAYIVHLPVPATESNAIRTSNQGKTLEWEFPLAQAVRGPVTTGFSAAIPIPPWIYASAVAGLGMSGLFLFVLAKRFLKPGAQPPV